MDIESQYMVVVDEIEKCRKKNKVSKEKLSKYQEELCNSRQQVLASMEEVKSLKQEVVEFKEEVKKLKDQLPVSEKFKESTESLIKVLILQRSSRDKTGLWYEKEKEPAYLPVSNLGGNQRSYDAL